MVIRWVWIVFGCYQKKNEPGASRRKTTVFKTLKKEKSFASKQKHRNRALASKVHETGIELGPLNGSEIVVWFNFLDRVRYVYLLFYIIRLQKVRSFLWNKKLNFLQAWPPLQTFNHSFQSVWTSFKWIKGMEVNVLLGCKAIPIA